MSTAIQRALTVARDPRIGFEYLNWLRRGGDVTFPLRNGARIGNFANFSEYHSMIGCISDTEQEFFLSRTPKDESVIIDIGANVGIVSALLGKQFPGRAIHAFEPAPTTYEALKKNMALNALPHVITHRAAVADKPGTLTFNANPSQRATARIALASDTHTVDVPAITLDAFVAEQGITSIGLLKVDVEGYEALVFTGAERVLAAGMARLIFMEICPPLTVSAGFDPAGPVRMIASAGYDWFRLEESGALTPVGPDDVASVDLENWVALPSS